MTRDGFTFLVMSFTGETAAKFKEEYINAFNNMEAIIRSQTPTLLPTYSERILSEPCHDVPKGYWTVFDKCHPIMIFIEKHIGSINKFDIVDGSIGSRWATYRKDKPWAEERKQYVHQYADQRGNVYCYCYSYSELQHFEEWLISTYKAEHLYDYLYNKYSNEKNAFMLDRVRKAQPLLIQKSAA
jgi:hypothetical protein